MEIIKKPRVIALTTAIVLLILLRNLSLIGGLILEVLVIVTEKITTEKE
ncbi:MAG: hypothetical protein HDR05_12485 [Lachnospiraceae bacterium]|nr:hypothetical protein [Lachnospiraceae bacterium]